MAEFVFTSPGLKFRERDITFVTKSVGITTLGLVGETLKGPAYEPIKITDKGEFLTRFGAQSVEKLSNGNLKYQLPYSANAYLEESNQLYVTRVLGLSGYDAGTAWVISLSSGVDPSTLVVGAPVVTNVNFSGNTYNGVSLYNVNDTGSYFTGFTKTGINFSGIKNSFKVTSMTGSTTGTVSVSASTITGTEYTDYTNMVLATIRSRGYVTPEYNGTPTTSFYVSGVTITGNTTITGAGDLFAEFTLVCALTNGGTELYTVSMNPNASNYISNVLGISAKDKKTKLWVQEIYPDLLKKVDDYGSEFLSGSTLSGISPYGFGINSSLINCTTDLFTNYNTQYKTPETPWVVSQLKGGSVDRLFKFKSISDGDNGNQEYKISIANIRPDTLEFDVLVRSFYDTDVSPIILESYTRCTMLVGETNFIGQKIGTSDGSYDIVSKYTMVELAENIPQESYPAGFEGYILNDYTTGGTGSNINGITPKIFYKQNYSDGEKVNRIFLGISNTAYDGISSKGTGINQNLFNFHNYANGNSITNFTKTKGFHLDSGATSTYYDGINTIGQFEVGADTFKGINDILNITNKYYSINTRKFTFVPSGGFDGWDVNNDQRTYKDEYKQGGIYDGVDPNVVPINDYQAWQTAINTFANPENITINVFATPGINWQDNTSLVQETIDIIELQRADTLYVIDSPSVEMSNIIGDSKVDVTVATDIAASLESTEIDSSYSCTYYPWCQLKDTQNNINVYLPPTPEVLKAIAFTDKSSFPWFAPAGLQRGSTGFKKSKYKLSQDARDILYKARINPMADFSETGNAIFGQKTLQKRESALDRINVRRLLLQIKVLISNIAIRLVFEQNDSATIDQFTSKVNPILDTIKRERGLYGFYVKMDDTLNTPESIDRNELYGEIYLQPTRVIEYIGIGFTITPTGASFTDLGA
jgi:hypothetical protein